MTLNLSPQIETKLTTTAQRLGLDPAALIEQIFEERFPVVQETESPKLTAKNAAALAMLRQWIADEATDDPEEIRKSEQEVEELMQNLNRNRIESGERPLFP